MSPSTLACEGVASLPDRGARPGPGPGPPPLSGHAASRSRAGHAHQEHVRLPGPGEDPLREGSQAAPARTAAQSLSGGAG